MSRTALLRSAFALALLVSTQALAEAPWVLVRNARNPVPSVTQEVLRKMLTGKVKDWEQGASLELILRDGETEELTWLAKTYWGSAVTELSRAIQKEAFRGEVALVSVASEKAALEALKGRVGGIALVTAEAARQLPPFARRLSITTGPPSAVAPRPIENKKLRLALVGNVRNPTTNLSKAALAKLLTGETSQWPEGAPVSIYLVRGQTPELKFLASIILNGKSDAVEEQFASDTEGFRVFIYRVEDAASCLRYVQADPGAIALVSAADIQPAIPGDLDFIRVTP